MKFESIVCRGAGTREEEEEEKEEKDFFLMDFFLSYIKFLSLE